MSATRKCCPESLNGQHENCEHGRKDFHCWHFTTKHPGTRRRYLGGRTRDFPWNHCLGHHPGTRFYMGGTTKYRCCRTTLDWNLGLSHASRQYGSSLLMLQPCRRNVGLAGFCIGTSEDDGHADDLPTLGKQRWKDIVFGKALTTGLWRLLSMVIGCGSKRILSFSRCTLVDRVKSCISFACALKGLPSGRQALTWLTVWGLPSAPAPLFSTTSTKRTEHLAVAFLR